MATKSEVDLILKLRSEIAKQLKTVDKQLKDLKSSSGRTQKGISDLGGTFKKGALQALALGTGVGAVAVGVGRLVSTLSEGIKSFLAFESSMTRIETLVGVGRQEVEGMTRAVRELSASSGRGTLELAEGLFQITSAGLRGKDAMDTLTAASKGARVGLGDVATIADIATSAMNAYGKENITAEKAVGVLLKTVREGKASPEELAASLGKIIPIAATMGVKFSEVSGIVASMTRIGFSGAESVTSLRGAMLSILNPSEQAFKVLDEVGLSMDDIRKTLDQDGLLAALELLRKNLSDEQFAKFIGRAEALAGVLGVTGSRFAETADIVESTADTVGDLDEATARVAETAADRSARFRKGWEAALDAVSEAAVKATLAIADGLAASQDDLDSSFDSEFGSTGVQSEATSLGSINAAATAFLATRTKLAALPGLGGEGSALAAAAEAAKREGEEARKAAESATEAAKKKTAADKLAAAAAKAHRGVIDELKASLGGAGLQKDLRDATQALEELGGQTVLTGIESLAGLIEDARKNGEELSPELRKVAEELNRIALAEGFSKIVDDLEAMELSAEDIADAMDGFSAATDAAIPPAVAGVGDLKTEFVDLSEVIRDLDSLFAVFGVNANSTLGSILSSTTLLGAQLPKLVAEFKKGGFTKVGGTIGAGDTAGTLSGISGGIAGIANATSSGSTAARTGKGALAGAAAGAQLGGPIGAAAGAIVGAVVGFIRGRRAKNLIRDASRDLGATITQEMADAIQKSGKPMQLAIADIFQAGGFESIDRFAEEIGDVFAGLSRGEFTKPEAIQTLEEAVPLLLQNLKELGPAGEAEIERIISAARDMGVEFDGLGDLINSTFAPQTLEQMKESLGLTGDEVRALAETLGVDLQTNLQRAATSAGLTTEVFKDLLEAAGEALGQDTAASVEDLEALMAATGLSAQELAERLGVDGAEGAGTLTEEMSKGGLEITNAADEAARLTSNLMGAGLAAGQIRIPGAGSFDAGGGIPSFASGGFVSRPTLAVVGDAPGGEYIVPAGSMRSGGGSAGSTVINVTVAVDAKGAIGFDENKAARAIAPLVVRGLEQNLSQMRTKLTRTVSE